LEVPQDTKIEEKYKSIPCFAYRLILRAKAESSLIPSDQVSIEEARLSIANNDWDMEAILKRAQAKMPPAAAEAAAIPQTEISSEAQSDAARMSEMKSKMLDKARARRNSTEGATDLGAVAKVERKRSYGG